MNIPAVVDVEEWISAQLVTKHDPNQCLCSQCHQNSNRPHTQLSDRDTWPPVVVFHTVHLAATRLRPSSTLRFPPQITDSQQKPGHYHLFAVTYHRHSHFTARILQSSRWFNYDGMAPSPTVTATRGTELETMSLLEDMDGQFPTHFLYMLQDADGI
jgi:hypothetical protein